MRIIPPCSPPHLARRKSQRKKSRSRWKITCSRLRRLMRSLTACCAARENSRPRSSADLNCFPPNTIRVAGSSARIVFIATAGRCFSPVIPWQSIDLKQFNLVPKAATGLLQKIGEGWGSFRIVPVESGRGCPYGCEFCTVTGFFGDSIRFRTNESVVNELLLLKARARSERGQIAVFFIDDNFAINIKRTKSLLRDIIAANAQVHWVAQISANLLRDEELVDLIAASGGKWVFIGMESIDPANLASVNKGFNKPGEYAAVLERLAQRNVYAITSFIFGMDNDTPGCAERTLKEIRTWPPGLPIFGLLTPLPATPLYKRLLDAGRLTRPKHWEEFIPFEMAHTPLKMTIAEAHAEVKYGWANSYSR